MPRATLCTSLFLLGVLVIASCGTALENGREDGRASEADIDLETIAIGSFHYHWNWCRKCHFSSGRSGSTARGPSLIDGDWKHCDGSIEGIAGVLRSGVEEAKIHDSRFSEPMPPASMMNLTEEHVRAIATYVWVLNQAPPQTSVEPVR